MSKRPHENAGDREGPLSKRSRPSPTGLLLEHADSLIRCLQDLKTTTGGPTVEARLSILAKEILPAVETLAASPNQQGQHHTTPGDGQAADSRIHIPSQVALTAWKASDIPSSLPPLPKVHDPVLEAEALRHQGQVCSPGQRSYERLEWIGDIYIEMMATSLIYQTFPKRTAGQCTQLRELIVRNLNLGSYSIQYGLDKRADLPAEFDVEGRENGTTAKRARNKVLGDIFEAYVAAIILSDPAEGLERAGSWLKALWAMTLKDDIQKELHQQEAADKFRPQRQEVTAKVELAQAIQVPGLSIDYKEIAGPRKCKKSGLPMFNIGAFLTGWGETNKLLGQGTAKSKAEAGIQAAGMALGNKKLMKEYKAKKSKYIASQGRAQDRLA